MNYDDFSERMDVAVIPWCENWCHFLDIWITENLWLLAKFINYWIKFFKVLLGILSTQYLYANITKYGSDTNSTFDRNIKNLRNRTYNVWKPFSLCHIACIFIYLSTSFACFSFTLQKARGFSGFWKDFKSKSFSFSEQVASSNNPRTTLCVYCANIWKILFLKLALPQDLNKTNDSSGELFAFKFLVMT